MDSPPNFFDSNFSEHWADIFNVFPKFSQEWALKYRSEQIFKFSKFNNGFDCFAPSESGETAFSNKLSFDRSFSSCPRPEINTRMPPDSIS